FLSGLEAHPAGEDVHRLVLDLVVLQAERVPGLDVQDLPHVAIGPGPDQLMAPGLLDADGALLGHGRPQREGMTTAGLRSSRSTSFWNWPAASLSLKAPTLTRYQVPFAPRLASTT